jgi:hypothetical protein
MNSDCKEGFSLRGQFEFRLKEWGWFDAYERALEILPVGLPKIHEFKQEAEEAHAALLKSRYAYVQHMASCLVCSGKLVVPDAVAAIRAKLTMSHSTSNS